MRKFVAGLAVVLALTACSNGSNETAEPTPTKTVSVSASPTPVETQTPVVSEEENLEDAVRTYSRLFLTGDGYKAYEMLSNRCQGQVDKNYFAGITLAAKSRYGNLPVEQIKVAVDGDKATATYTFSNPEINQTDEPWVKEETWKNDQC